jgi:hypothetical protein
MKSTLVLGLTAVALTACMGRVPEPVAVQSERDASLTCVALDAEKAGNEERVRYLRQEQDGSEHMNLVIGSFAVVAFLPAAAAMDISDAEEVEMRALNKRNARVEAMRAARGCITAPLVPQGYTAYERGEERYQDASGRVVTLPSNTYVYDQPTATAAGAPAQQLGLTNGVTQD